MWSGAAGRVQLLGKDQWVSGVRLEHRVIPDSSILIPFPRPSQGMKKISSKGSQNHRQCSVHIAPDGGEALRFSTALVLFSFRDPHLFFVSSIDFRSLLPLTVLYLQYIS